MENALILKLLLKRLTIQKTISLNVAGDSMTPSINSGDEVIIERFSTYSVGDILVFIYKGELLIHRLLKVNNEYYFCKGDNSFRLENVTFDNIIGKVVTINGRPVPLVSPYHISLSYLVNREFRKCGYHIVRTKQSGIYKFYVQTMMQIENKELKYQRNKALSNDNEMDVCNSFNSDDFNEFNEIDCQIVNLLIEQHTFDAIVSVIQKNQIKVQQDVFEYVRAFLIRNVALGNIFVYAN